MAICCYSRCNVLKVLVALYMLWLPIFLSQDDVAYLICPNTTTYTRNSTYQVNLHSLLSTLSSDNTRNNLFYNATAGKIARDRAYGLFMCRGDVTVDTCHGCVVNATRQILQVCPKEKEAYIWHDECMLRYDNQSFFSTMDDKPGVSLYNVENVTEPDRLEQVLNSTMNELATRASSDQSNNGGHLRGFATGEANITSNETLYSLVQCTQDLSGADCKSCFHAAFAKLQDCCSGKQGGRVLLPSCNIRYETYPFYNTIAGAAPSPSPTPSLPPPAPRTSTPTVPALPPPAPGPSSSLGGNGRLSAQVITAGVFVAVVAPILLFTNEVSITGL